ncbi:hypothetical protein [Gracilibacillus lacisalsi]|uniref:hypothetical protein n=1 Tax=Gracilibacillus lacisalsi TaxID=393087 RepID=UPI0003655892|nr:hypothetical protein [Gracilibacillus lacisalsi]
MWTAIGFHLGYLEITRFVVNNNYYGSSILSYQESFPGLGVLFISLGMIVAGGIVVSLFILGIKRLLQKN